MALSLNGIEPVKIKGKICTPKLDAETRLRLAEIKTYDRSTDLVLASAFPDDEEYVRKFLEEAPAVEKEILHAYLVGGETAASSVIDNIKDGLKNAMASAVENNND